MVKRYFPETDCERMTNFELYIWSLYIHMYIGKDPNFQWSIYSKCFSESYPTFGAGEGGTDPSTSSNCHTAAAPADWLLLPAVSADWLLLLALADDWLLLPAVTAGWRLLFPAAPVGCRLPLLTIPAGCRLLLPAAGLSKLVLTGRGRRLPSDLAPFLFKDNPLEELTWEVTCKNNLYMLVIGNELIRFRQNFFQTDNLAKFDFKVYLINGAIIHNFLLIIH